MIAAAGLRAAEANRTGRMLWVENVKSVACRYPRDTPGPRPGPVSENIDAEAESYVYVPQLRRLSPVEVLKLIASYEYQSCEHDEWESSLAKQWCEQRRAKMIHELPGWGDAAWEV